MRATDRLRQHGIAFERHKACLTIRHAGRVIDYRIESAQWIERGSSRPRIGMRELIRHLEGSP